jgi:catechol 2,3-dioxygenase
MPDVCRRNVQSMCGKLSAARRRDAVTSPLPQALPFGIPPPEFRLHDGTRVGGVHLQVSDVRQSVEYYEKVIGLRARHRQPHSVALTTVDAEEGLVTLHTRPGVTRARRGAFGLYHFALLLPDRAALGRCAAHLASSDVRVSMADHLVSEALYLWDPDGLGIEIYADRPPHAWQRNGRELAMTTDPLDINSVIAAGLGELWTGIPGGTTIGHVHLHVGSLDVAESFYHRGLGFDKTVWSYPGALFMSAGGYHHHLATNTWSPGPAPAPAQAQLIEWELMVPSERDVTSASDSLNAAGYIPERSARSVTIADPWGTRVRILAQD